MEENIFSLIWCIHCQRQYFLKCTCWKPLPQLDFPLSLAARLLDGYKQPVDRRHIATTTVLPMKLSKHGFSEPVQKDTPYGGCSQCQVCKDKGKKDHKNSTNVTL